jgi:hypothetical protein
MSDQAKRPDSGRALALCGGRSWLCGADSLTRERRASLTRADTVPADPLGPPTELAPRIRHALGGRARGAAGWSSRLGASGAYVDDGHQASFPSLCASPASRLVKSGDGTPAQMRSGWRNCSHPRQCRRRLVQAKPTTWTTMVIASTEPTWRSMGALTPWRTDTSNPASKLSTTAAKPPAKKQRPNASAYFATTRHGAQPRVVRREWLKIFVSRKSAPKGAQRFIFSELALGGFQLCDAMEAPPLRLRPARRQRRWRA